MRVLVVHNRYQSDSPSGENDVVTGDVAMLRAAGLEVATYFRDSDELKGASPATRLNAAIGPVYSRHSARTFNEVLELWRPDVVHVHNVFPLIGPPVVHLAAKRGISVVQTVHNYRHTCLNGLHVREGRRCDDCLGKRWPMSGVLHGCYRGSHLQSLPMALSQGLHRSTWGEVARFLALTPFMADRLHAAGIAREAITVRPNAAPDPGPPQPLGSTDVLFVARLDSAKGVEQLLRAWSHRSPSAQRLVIAGDGPMAAAVRRAAMTDPSIEYLGRVSPDAVVALMRRAAAVVMPSVVYEGFPLTLAEAFAAGRGVIVAGHGSPASVVTDRDAWIYNDQDEYALTRAFAAVTMSCAAAKGLVARARYEREFTPEIALASLLAVYTDVTATAVGKLTKARDAP